MMELRIGDAYVYKNGRVFTIDVEERKQVVMDAIRKGDIDFYYPVSSRIDMGFTQTDSPTKPSHYGKLDVFTYAREHFTDDQVNAYHQITAIKYITRAGKKDGNPFEQDIKKAIVHLEECLKE